MTNSIPFYGDSKVSRDSSHSLKQTDLRSAATNRSRFRRLGIRPSFGSELTHYLKRVGTNLMISAIAGILDSTFLA
jgi:hypothetical protein